MNDPRWFDRSAIGRRLQAARGGRSQKDLGGALGYLQPQVSRYEAGEVPGSYRLLAGLAALFDVDVNWVLTGRRAESRQSRGAARPPRVPRSASRVPPDLLVAAPLSEWDRLQIELPLLLTPLLVRGAGRGAEVSAREEESQDGNDPGAPAKRVRAFLRRLESHIRRGRGERAADEIVRFAGLIEDERPPGLPAGAARWLLLWALAVLDSHPWRGAERRRAEVLFRIGRAGRMAGDLDSATDFYRAALEAAEAAGELDVTSRCHSGMGHVRFERGEFERARGHYVAALELALRAGMPRLLYFAYLDLAAYYHEHERDYGKALEYARTGLHLAEREGDREHTGRFLNELGLNHMELGEGAAAATCFERVLELARELRSPVLHAIGGNNLADLRIREGANGEALELLARGRAAAREGGLAWADCQAEILTARAEHGSGRSVAALERLDRVEDRCVALGLAHEERLACSAAREIRRDLLGLLDQATGSSGTP
ncbi:MAG: helix-turn-helix domain-containing protein [Gemmatimonadota bacterium]